MQNNIFNKINVSSRLLALLLLTLSLMITNSISFIVLISILVLILLILSKKSVKCYIDLIKNIKFLLLFIFIAYIIILGSIFSAILFLHKTILMILLMRMLIYTVNFQSLTNGIKTFLKPLENIIKIDDISINISLFIYFINYYINSKQEILSKYSKDEFNFKNNLLPRLFLTNYKLKIIESDLKRKFYSPKFETNNKRSNIIVFVFAVFLIIIIFKEVIS